MPAGQLGPQPQPREPLRQLPAGPAAWSAWPLCWSAVAAAAAPAAVATFQFRCTFLRQPGSGVCWRCFAAGHAVVPADNSKLELDVMPVVNVTMLVHAGPRP